MPTVFKNTKFKEDGSEGQIETVSTFSVWICITKSFSAPPVVLRNTLLGALYPYKEFIIGEIPKTTKDPSLLDPFEIPGVQEPYFLDLASNSRTHGRFLFTPNRTIGRDYFSEDWKRIIYGSILHTECNRMFYREMKYIIVDDERQDRDGNPQDDGVNGVHWNSGDCHAKMSKSLLYLLEATETDPGNPIDIDPNNPEHPITVQFCAALFQEWVAKGTASYHPKFELDKRFADYDLVIPLSCFKGNKPALGNHTGKVLIGVVHEAEERRAKPGWMLWQWFKFETLEQDGIITRLHEKCHKLSSALDNIQSLAEILRVDLEEAEQELANLDDNPDAEVAYVDVVLKIIKADKAGVLLLHPYILSKIKFRLQEMWKNLAKAAGVRFYSVMCTPDTYLEKYQQADGNDFVYQPKIFCSASFKEGSYIVFGNPIQHWGNVQLWNNVYEGNFKNTKGILAATRELLLSLGRDANGDYIQLINSQIYPSITAALYEMDSPPKVKKLPNVALKGNLQQIAVNSMNNLAGIVGSLTGRARAIGAELIVLNIPGEGEMRIIDFLAQEMQIAVDSFKSAYPNNQEGLKVVREFLDKSGADIQWLKDLKSDDCYLTRPCLTNPPLTDTVTRIINIVNSYWRYPNLKEDTTPKDYRFTLFSNVYTDEIQDMIAKRERDAYRTEMGEAINHKNLTEDDSRIKEVTAKFKAQTEEIMQNTLNPFRKPYPPRTWAAAYWRSNHLANSGTASLVFLLFCDEIIEELQSKNNRKVWLLSIYAVQYTTFARPQHSAWNGEELTVRSSFVTVNGSEKVSIEAKFDNQPGFIHMGLVPDKMIADVPNGLVWRVKIFAKTYENDRYPRRMSPNDVCTSLFLFSVDMLQEDIDDFMTDHWQNNSRFNPLPFP
ncbi:hypothetical protein [Planktothrix mougeotii]|uniref:Uncharacterized protein n=1 Tax=Planktothrix mougeotii LEGE 06226 TaxID=1828728 RepID=A0ABR9UDR2_9CYAN|nr:hypothetical protein [Planktothrix mougeotii]MBE9144610.1 hypothetical protein [Planktothrix mougeotii LEGE 06226]